MERMRNESEPGAAGEAGRRLARGVCRLLADHGYRTLCELPLGDGRRADVFAIDRRGNILIVEVKSSLADFRADGKWPAYLASCDRFAFAVPAEFPQAVLPEAAGLIVADAYGGAVIRPPMPATALPAARRKALLLRFARTAAARLQQSLDAAAADRFAR